LVLDGLTTCRARKLSEKFIHFQIISLKIFYFRLNHF